MIVGALPISVNPFQAAHAATSEEQLYDQGRNYNQYIYPGGNQKSYQGYSTVVISDSAHYYYGYGYGRERIRMWARLDTINNIYPTYNYINRIEKMNLRFSVKDSRGDALMLNAVSPTNHSGG